MHTVEQLRHAQDDAQKRLDDTKVRLLVEMCCLYCLMIVLLQARLVAAEAANEAQRRRKVFAEEAALARKQQLEDTNEAIDEASAGGYG